MTESSGPNPLMPRSETESVEFKSRFDAASKQHWCELVKDIVAMANSGGGLILFGVNDDGVVVSDSEPPRFAADPADVTNKIFSYTGQHFTGCRASTTQRSDHQIPALTIEAARIPMVFTSPGTYPTGTSTQKTAFAQGTVYFRHGAKSEPGTSDDLRASIERELRTNQGLLAPRHWQGRCSASRQRSEACPARYQPHRCARGGASPFDQQR